MCVGEGMLDGEVTGMAYGSEVKGPGRSCKVYVVEGRLLNAVKF